MGFAADLVATVLTALWLMLPAYLGNMMPVFVGGGAPIDGGRLWSDGRPILGPGKTWRGLILGPLMAAGLVAILRWIVLGTGWRGVQDWSVWGPDAWWPAWWFLFAYLMGLGALVGDATKSFFKRRTGRDRGAKWPFFDQLDFVVGSLVFAYVAALVLAPFAGREFLDDITWPRVVVLVLLTPGLHLLVNWMGYKLGFKQVPW